MWEILLISLPICYIIGLITIIKYLINLAQNPTAKPKETSRTEYLSKAIAELSQLNDKNPDIKLNELINQYREELIHYNQKFSWQAPSSYTPTQPSQPIKAYSTHTPSSSITPSATTNFKQDLSQSYNNWYSENSINLLLYIGAFLIVASAAIFVGFQWETISGTAKAIIITLLSLSFFSAGFICLRYPKIKNAALTFIAIGALLIPFTGLAWYNFVLKDLNISFGEVWLATSLLSLTTYSALSYYLKNQAYTYVSSLSTLSLALSLVNVYGLQSDYYILAAILSAFILTLGRLVLKNQSNDAKEIYAIPMEYAANILMPITLLLGLITAVNQEKLFTFQATLSLFLATIFYLISYLGFKQIATLALAQILFLLTVVLFGNWKHVDPTILLYILDLFAAGYLILGHLFKNTNQSQQTDTTLAIGTATLLTVFCASIFINYTPLNSLIFSLLVILTGIFLAQLYKQIEYLTLSNLFLAISVFILINQYLKINTDYHLLGIIYLILSILYWLCSVKFKKNQHALQTQAK